MVFAFILVFCSGQDAIMPLAYMDMEFLARSYDLENYQTLETLHIKKYI